MSSTTTPPSTATVVRSFSTSHLCKMRRPGATSSSRSRSTTPTSTATQARSPGMSSTLRRPTRHQHGS
ncbi:hypothetical protein ACFPRL_34820 [Pseudoclavibacter helvolus]